MTDTSLQQTVPCTRFDQSLLVLSDLDLFWVTPKSILPQKCPSRIPSRGISRIAGHWGGICCRKSAQRGCDSLQSQAEHATQRSCLGWSHKVFSGTYTGRFRRSSFASCGSGIIQTRLGLPHMRAPDKRVLSSSVAQIRAGCTLGQSGADTGPGWRCNPCSQDEDELQGKMIVDDANTLDSA